MIHSLSGFQQTAPARAEWLPVLIGLLVLFVPTFYDLSVALRQQDDQAHGPIILLVVVWLIWQEREALFFASAKPARILGNALLAFGLLVYVLGRFLGNHPVFDSALANFR